MMLENGMLVGARRYDREEQGAPMVVGRCCICGEELTVLDTYKQVGQELVCWDPECARAKIMRDAGEEDYKAYCKACKEEFYKFCELDEKVFGESTWKSTAILYDFVGKQSKFKEFATINSYDFAQWYEENREGGTWMNV